VTAHIDRAPAPEEVLPTDMMTVAMDEMVPRDGSLAPEAVLKVISSTAGGAVAAMSERVAPTDGPTSSSSPVAGAPSSPPRVVVNGNTVEEPEVILGHRPVEASGDVSLSDAMGTTHFVLN
jgi:hypothetical protein